MKIIHKPTVYLVGKQIVQPDVLGQFLSDHGVNWQSDSDAPAEVLAETAGRLCYMSFAKPRPGGNAAYLTHIKEVRHGSICEHGVWNFVITGVSRTLTHELVRHRAGFAYSQLSQRYVDESVAEYVCPDIIAADPELHAIWLKAVQHAHESYVKLSNGLNEKLQHRWGVCDSTNCTNGWQAEELKKNHYIACPTCKGEPKRAFYASKLAAMFLPDDADKTAIRKTARQAARSVLPNATETKIFVTANARALRHFLEQRGSAAAEPEIRKLANAMLVELKADSPNLFGDYQTTQLPDGTFEITTQYPKV